MTPLIEAELLRLRTVRTPLYLALGALVLAGTLAALDVLDSSFGRGSNSVLRAESLRLVALNGGLIAAVFAASSVGTEFKRGGVALTYLSQPNRWRVTAARALTYAGVCGVVSALAAGVAVAVGLIAANGQGIAIDLGAARVIGGAAFGGAVLAGAGVLVATLVRNPTVAISAVVAPTILAGVPGISAVHPYLPLGLMESLIGIGHEVAAPVAMALLLAYPAALVLFVRGWALERDLT